MILCDTNILIEFYKGNPQIVDCLRKVGPSNLAISVITAGELFYGAKDKRELKIIQKHLSQLQQIPWIRMFQPYFCRYWGNML